MVIDIDNKIWEILNDFMLNKGLKELGEVLGWR